MAKYTYTTPIQLVKGVGPKLKEKFLEKNIQTVEDILMKIPLGFMDYSQVSTIQDLEVDTPATVEATITATSNFYKRGRSIQTATAKDETGTIKLYWFNTPFIIKSIQKGEKYAIAGQKNAKGSMVHPALEKFSTENIHTGRIVPRYSTSIPLTSGKLRRLYSEILAGLDTIDPLLEKIDLDVPKLADAFRTIHFPEEKDQTQVGLKRLALEEMLTLINHAKELKKHWKSNLQSVPIKTTQPKIPDSIPFELTAAQTKATNEILADIAQKYPMNRLLVGDVGSGKTVVAGLALYHTIRQGHSAAIVAPTKILADQHLQTFKKLFPDIEVNLITGRTKKFSDKPCLYIGTHAILNRSDQISPALIVFDEQHRFGVDHRSIISEGKKTPHLLTMSATPIPRSYMLTIFSHLELSVIDEMPVGRKQTITSCIKDAHKAQVWQRIESYLDENPDQTAIVVCPFINPSDHEALENVAAAEETFTELQAKFKKSKHKLGLLHGKQKQKDKDKITQELFDKKLNILVTTPIVEVGVDLPSANIIVILAAQRFGLASLHQLRGRVGRGGQQGFCVVVDSSKSKNPSKRLEKFTQTTNGFQVAEEDLKHRGAGDMFGTKQHGFDALQFADWADVKLITMAREVAESLPEWEPTLVSLVPKVTEKLPAAN